MINPKTTLAALLSLESVFEKAFQTILSQADIDRVYITRETETFETPCVELTVIVGDVNLKHQVSIRPNMPEIYDCWDSSLQVRVKTNRGSNSHHHSILCGKVRAALTLYSLMTTFTSTDAARFHSITDIREQGGDTAFDDATNVDTTVLSFYLLLNISENAWHS
jgi:hypothetical protein